MCLSCKGVWGHATPDISVWHLQEACKELHGTGYCSQVEDGSAASFPATVAPWWVSCSGRRYEGRFSRFVEMGKPDNWISSLHYETCCPLNVCCQAFCNTFVFLGHSAKFGSYSLMSLESNTRHSTCSGLFLWHKYICIIIWILHVCVICLVSFLFDAHSLPEQWSRRQLPHGEGGTQKMPRSWILDGL